MRIILIVCIIKFFKCFRVVWMLKGVVFVILLIVFGFLVGSSPRWK